MSRAWPKLPLQRAQPGTRVSVGRPSTGHGMFADSIRESRVAASQLRAARRPPEATGTLAATAAHVVKHEHDPRSAASFVVAGTAVHCAGGSALLHDRRGLSTLEYSVLFVLIVIGAIALWSKLGQDMDSQLARGGDAFAHMLQNARVANSDPPGSAPAPGPVLANAAPQIAARAQRPADPAVAVDLSAAARSASGSTRAAASAPPTPAASSGQATAADGDWRSQKVGTGGKVAVVAAGAAAGAAMAAGTSIATAYVASLACGPGAPVCAGAVTVAIGVGLAGYGVHQLMNGGWSALKGSYSRVFSSEDANGGDALSVGTTLGAAAYGVGTTGLSGASGAARGQAIAQVGARAGAATRAEIASVLTGSTPELAMAGVPNANANPVPGIVRMSGADKVGSAQPAAVSGSVVEPIPPRPSGNIGPVTTPYGPAAQATSAEALAARGAVSKGATIWRVGTTSRSEAAEAQFWSLEHPLSPGFVAASKSWCRRTA